MSARRAGERQAAIALWERVLERDPFNKSAIVPLVREALRAGDAEALFRHLAAAIVAAPEAALPAIGILANTGHAIRVTPLALELRRRHPEVEAVKTLTDSLTQTHIKSARVFRQKGDTSNAVAALRAALTLDPGRQGIQAIIARMFAVRMRGAQQAGSTEARGILAGILAEDPENLAALRLLARLEARSGAPATALAHFVSILTLDPSDHDAARRAYPLVHKYGETGQQLLVLEASVGSAADDIQRAAVLRQALVVARSFVAQPDYIAACRACRVALAIDAEQPTALNLLAAARRGLAHCARDCLRRKDPQAFRLLIPDLVANLISDEGWMKIASRHLGRLTETPGALEQALAISREHPDMIEGHVAVALLATANRDIDVAEDATQNALRLDPANEAMRDNTARLTRARAGSAKAASVAQP